MVKLTNGMRVSMAEAMAGQDDKNKTLKWEQQKGANVPVFTAKGTDQQDYSFTVDSAIVTVGVAPKTNLKELRRKGFPVPKGEAKKLDEEIRKEREEQELATATTDEEKNRIKEMQAERRKEEDKEGQGRDSEQLEEQQEDTEELEDITTKRRRR